MIKRDPRAQLLHRQLQQLILLRETGPKSAAWHEARTRLIWRLHDEIKRDEDEGEDERPEDDGEKGRQGEGETV